ncbi:hypothetical protein D3C73_1283360 [compost metagenome]
MLRHIAQAGGGLKHGFEVIEQVGAPGGIGRQHAEPQIDTNSVVASLRVLAIDGSNLPGLPHQPVRCEAFGSALDQQAPRVLRHFGPYRCDERKAR